MGHWPVHFNNLLTLFLASTCPLCQRSTHQELCPTCQRQIGRCQLPQLTPVKADDFPILAWGNYGGALKRAIASLKYEQQPQIARPLGHELAKAWLQSPLQPSKSLVVVPIPVHDSKRKQRGYDQADLLASSFCEVTGISLQKQVLKRVRATEAQFGLSVAAREKNLTDAFQVDLKHLRHSKRSVLLLDDIYTTGATVRAARQVFQQHNIPVAGLAVVARPQFQERPG